MKVHKSLLHAGIFNYIYLVNYVSIRKIQMYKLIFSVIRNIMMVFK